MTTLCASSSRRLPVSVWSTLTVRSAASATRRLSSSPAGFTSSRAMASPRRLSSGSEAVEGIRFLAEDTGVFAETAGGVSAAGALALASAGRLEPRDEVVLCITGHGLKTVDAVHPALPEAPVIAPRLRDVTTLVEEERIWPSR